MTHRWTLLGGRMGTDGKGRLAFRDETASGNDKKRIFNVMVQQGVGPLLDEEFPGVVVFNSADAPKDYGLFTVPPLPAWLGE